MLAVGTVRAVQLGNRLVEFFKADRAYVVTHLHLVPVGPAHVHKHVGHLARVERQRVRVGVGVPGRSRSSRRSNPLGVEFGFGHVLALPL